MDALPELQSIHGVFATAFNQAPSAHSADWTKRTSLGAGYALPVFGQWKQSCTVIDTDAFRRNSCPLLRVSNPPTTKRRGVVVISLQKIIFTQQLTFPKPHNAIKF